MSRIYLDHNATTPVDPAVLEALLPFLGGTYGNPSSVHREGQAARRAVDRAREQVAALLGAKPDEIVFTSGGTEANQLALAGGVEGLSEASGRSAQLVVGAVEHPAVLETARALGRLGHRLTIAPVDGFGRVEPREVVAALDGGPALVSVMRAQNDVGTLQPVAELAAALDGRALIHTDAVQAVGKLPVAVEALGVDLLSLSAHKLHGPKGVGALYVRRGAKVSRQLHGGSQELRRRAGTENVPGIVGLGVACELAAARLSEAARVAALRDRLAEELERRLPGLAVHGHPVERLPNTLHVSLPGLSGNTLLMGLDLEGIAASVGSACASGEVAGSPALRAMGLSEAEVLGSLRFSLGRGNTGAEIDRTAEVLARLVTRLRGSAVDVAVAALTAAKEARP